MKGSDFIFYPVQFLYYKCHEVNSKRDSSYIDSPDQIKKEKNNPKNTDDECLQYAVTLALKYGKIESHQERVSNINNRL